MSILKRITDALDPVRRVVVADLKRLNELQDELGDQAAEYVLTGEPETVLASLHALGRKGGQAIEAQNQWARNSETTERRKQLLRADPYDVDQAVRYAKVLSAVCDDADLAGPRKAPKEMRAFFGEIFLAAPEDRGEKIDADSLLTQSGLSLELAHEIATHLGGDMTDLVEILYHETPGWRTPSPQKYRRKVAMHSLLDEQRESVAAAAERLPGSSLVELINDLRKFDLAYQAPYFDVVLKQTGGSAKATREAAFNALSNAPRKQLETAARQLLSSRESKVRLGMVQLLGMELNPDTLSALEEHLEKEKTASVRAAIETLIAASAATSGENTDDADGYTAVDGERIVTAPIKFPQEEEAVVFGAEDKRALRELIDEENKLIDAHNMQVLQRNPKAYQRPRVPRTLPGAVIDALNLDKGRAPSISARAFRDLPGGKTQKWLSEAFARMPLESRLRLSVALRTDMRDVLRSNWFGPFGVIAAPLEEYLNSPQGDLRVVEHYALQYKLSVSVGDWQHREKRPAVAGDLAAAALSDAWRSIVNTLPDRAVAPFIVANFEVFDRAFGMAPSKGENLSRHQALKLLARLPKTPARYVAPLLDIATGTQKLGRDLARDLLKDAPEVPQRLATLLGDSRETARSEAARWMAERGDKDGAKAIRARLKKEKSDRARAAMLSALDKYGQDLKEFLGPKALIAEAEKGLKKAKFDKISWLVEGGMPRVRFKNGSQAPEELTKWWAFLAFKLKDPGGGALFDLYLEQLKPDDAAAFAGWVLESWIGYDVGHPSESEANAYVENNVDARLKQYQRWNAKYTREQLFAEMKSNYLQRMPNSGAASKGLLALARSAPASLRAERVRSYLKNHGSRTSQASSLLQMQAAAGDPLSLQVVIAAATRLKQKGVQRLAGQLIDDVAKERNWTMDELADRTVPTAGLDDECGIDLPSGAEGKIYRARLDETLKLALQNPQGKTVKSLPSGSDEVTKASKKQFSTAKKELKQVVSMETARLYEAMCSAREWRTEDWLRDFREHPLMRKITERIVWLGLDEQGAHQSAFRPTAEGDYTDAEDEEVTPADFPKVKIAHGAMMSEEAAGAWLEHLTDYEVEALFMQFGRALLRLPKEMTKEAEIEDRKGWTADAFTFRGAASKLGYERGEPMDGGFFDQYRKNFASAGLTAVISFTGNCLPEDNVRASLKTLHFEEKSNNRYGGGSTLGLGQVPPALLSECWNDYHDMAAKAAHDPDWEKSSPW